MSQLTLGFSLTFNDLYQTKGLASVDKAFLSSLTEKNPELAQRLNDARHQCPENRRLEANLIHDLAPFLDNFIAELFSIEKEVAAFVARQNDLSPLYTCKRLFVQRRALKASYENFDPASLKALMTGYLGQNWRELDFAKNVMLWLADEDRHEKELEAATHYACWALRDPEGIATHKSGRLFKVPQKHDPLSLVHATLKKQDGVEQWQKSPEEWTDRLGFNLTDQGTDLIGSLDEIHYCILCHHQGKDSCSTGLLDKKEGGFSKTAVGAVQAGCPLEERISEMHSLKAKGYFLSAIATAIIDNPMIAGTGHRICNDCMTACIYTNGHKDPVNIPEAETRSLKDLLELPWGFEIYSLLTKWNPLNFRRPLPRSRTGRTILVAGLGPAGYTLAHHLMNDGHSVVAIDGLKIEPLDPRFSGKTASGESVDFEPIRDVTSLYESLGSRILAGFGGVAEYGITVRWNKNFLKIIRLLLERRQDFLMIGGVRLGSQLTLDDAFAMRFDHIALCMGAGRPTIIDMPNNLSRGVRQASDFLMALQLTGAAKSDSLANLQVRLPIVVVGGGLTAIDSCTESLAYYPVQVLKFLERYDILVSEKDEKTVRVSFTEEENHIADEFLRHGRALKAEIDRAKKENRPAKIQALLDSWGGATLVYRRSLIESPAYRNHEEVNKALEEGIRIADRLSPLGVEIDEFGHATGLKVKDLEGKISVIPAKTVIVAAGTVPNSILAREDGRIQMDGKYFQAIDESLSPITPEKTTKPQTPYLLVGAGELDSKLSFFGDLHPSFAGNVVSAMASAKQGYPVISRILEKASPSRSTPEAIFAHCSLDFRATVHDVIRLAPTIIEVVLKAPAAARAFQPGLFYRLQNFETLAPYQAQTRLAMEGLALTGAWVDKEKGLVSVIVLEMGGSSDLCKILKIGEPVSLMGPTGEPTETPMGETVLLVGGGLGNAVLFSIGRALRQVGSKVLYFAGYRNGADRFKMDDIEAAADQVVWCVDKGDPLSARRPQDLSFVGNIVEAITAYASGSLGQGERVDLATVNRIIAIGSDRMMRAVAQARHGVLAPYLNPDHAAIGSINSPMQCMMKEICAQCLQKHHDPKTGKDWIVFTCANQDQKLDTVDFDCLNQRLQQNSLPEKLTKLWIDRAVHAR
jgi:NADPH-dependent glutamate synthase beta subunit-like oxidoreductase/NAD(P)H-flavin reductase